MSLSKKLLHALNEDRYYNDEEMHVDPREFYPKLMEFYDYLCKIENNSFVKLHDLWEVKRPFGLHDIGKVND